MFNSKNPKRILYKNRHARGPLWMWKAFDIKVGLSHVSLV